jgi:hypothetical protein
MGSGFIRIKAQTIKVYNWMLVSTHDIARDRSPVPALCAMAQVNEPGAFEHDQATHQNILIEGLRLC